MWPVPRSQVSASLTARGLWGEDGAKKKKINKKTSLWIELMERLRDLTGTASPGRALAGILEGDGGATGLRLHCEAGV